MTEINQDEQNLGDRQFANTLARGMDVLRCFSPDRPHLSNKELSVMTGMPKATVSRFTYTLVQLGYLRSDKISGRYMLAPAILTLAYPLLSSLGVRQMARPAMHDFANAVQGSVSLGMRERMSIVYVETARARSVYSAKMAEVGMAHSLIVSAIGRAYLCACTLVERDALINEVKVKDPDLWEKYRNSVEKSLAEYRELRFCYSYGDLRPDIYAVATPLHREPNAEIVVINCVLQSYQVAQGELESNYGPRLVSLVSSLALGAMHL